jgi:hypothetical protein
MKQADEENLGKTFRQNVKRGYNPIAGQAPHHESFPPIAVGEPAEKWLDQELTDGKAGNDQAQLEIGGSFLRDINGEEGDDKT